MQFPYELDQFEEAVRRVYGEPYQTPDGTTVLPVAKVRRRARRGAVDGGEGFVATPMGVFVVRGEQAHWVAAIDANRMALIGVLTGFAAAVIGSLAILRRPPWPDLSG